jgi:hypothetical protein
LLHHQLAAGEARSAVHGAAPPLRRVHYVGRVVTHGTCDVGGIQLTLSV